ncbi:hypothetical protein BJ166DRAFT_230884 [Pestalotiopsis sp. NC0098]|nr:hypothetical protein BJ166DRAFT_230884 [Pestalotiopsis sp. NC0098]
MSRVECQPSFSFTHPTIALQFKQNSRCFRGQIPLMHNFRPRAKTGESLRNAPDPPVPRMARSFQAIMRQQIDRLAYPSTHDIALCPSLHDIPSIQGLFANGRNFAAETICQVFDVMEEANNEMTGSWKFIAGEQNMVAFISSIKDSQSPRPKLRVIFNTIASWNNTSFGVQLSVSKHSTLQLLSALSVCPQYCSSMLGEPDYWAPLAIKTRNDKGEVVRAEYIYQHPRYTIRSRQEPCSVWYVYDISSSTTTYIVTSGEEEKWVERAKERLIQYFIRSEKEAPYESVEVHDPFLFQSILCHESLHGAKTRITQLRHELLKAMTERLHQVSQDADSLLVSAEMGLMVADHGKRSRALLQTDVSAVFTHPFLRSNVGDVLEYLVQSLEAQKRWLSSYQSRKDIAMNLVFNLVTQQDSETGTEIARDAKADSASMKTIAVLTMIFLPATAVSGFFGMAFFDVSDDGVLISSALVWLFVAITVPLTVLVFFLVWVFWDSLLGWLLPRVSFKRH